MHICRKENVDREACDVSYIPSTCSKYILLRSVSCRTLADDHLQLFYVFLAGVAMTINLECQLVPINELLLQNLSFKIKIL